ncbi:MULTISPECIES: MaoC family dehydratase N-terminal domain-containing protein [unclassified Chelatococcus]|uniref:FAS1-like dehydratase domain-containing protein n=1 Tax=unclassified Chelatococcus TaxID=2638111 RepID=UPI001BD1ADB0|nr:MULTISPECIES: MaoC family dehydratase N-terminal domain-containing protein [unclassified Chelatococcus]MBS7697644.1 MaoC family dehydratase N-terminal domain-containing protein [Chelatococcus sp. YT9]MBX3559018.1 MaoC family dehydratase N-terminal domain-containing protein [Chelatococcus sp.]
MSNRGEVAPTSSGEPSLAQSIALQIGRVFRAHTIEVTADAIVAYARAIGETDPIYELSAPQRSGDAALPAPPTFLFTLSIAKPRPFDVYEELGIDQTRILHAEQFFRFERLIVAGQRLTFTPRLTGVSEKQHGSLLFVTTTTAVADETGQRVAELGTVIAIRQSGGGGQPRPANHNPVVLPPSARPVIAMPPVTPETLVRFAAASGDCNPIHLDSGAARAAGLDDVIAHGMLIAAYAGRAIGQWFPRRRIAQFATRFTGMTRLGDVISLSAEAEDKAPEPRSFIIAAHDQFWDLKLRSRVDFAA